MYAIVGTSDLDANRTEEAQQMAEGIVANISQAPGFVTAIFARSEDGTKGRSIAVFETRDAAQAVKDNAESMIPAGAPVENINLQIFEVAVRK